MYHYAANNPVKYTDPDGKIAFCAVTALIGTGIGAGIAAYNSYQETGQIDGLKVLEGAVKGGAIGLGPGVVGAEIATSTALQAGNCLASFTEVTGLVVTSTAVAAIATTTEKVSLNLIDESKTKSHMFSADHIKNGIMKLGSSANDIFNKTLNIIQKLNPDKIKNGPNEVRTTMNGLDATIRFFVKDGEVVNVDAFAGYSNRIVGNLVD